jgi:V-type H+-transporting ATPase subunit A
MTMEFPEISLPELSRDSSVMDKMAMFATTADMPAAVCEASIFSGMSVCEYIRDMGYNVSILADSTSRWEEALRGSPVGGSQGPSPSSLTSQIAKFYARGGRATCLGSPDREGSITIVGGVSPSGGDLSDPLTSTTLEVVDTFWAIDAKLARRKHFPSFNWLLSHSRCRDRLTRDFGDFDEFCRLRNVLEELLKDEEALSDEVQHSGKDGLDAVKQLTLDMARLIREDFLQQNMFSSYDRTCPSYKTLWMMRNIVHFYREARATMETHVVGACGCVSVAHSPSPSAALISWQQLQERDTIRDQRYKLSCMKFEEPSDGEAAVAGRLSDLLDKTTAAFRSIAGTSTCRDNH